MKHFLRKFTVSVTVLAIICCTIVIGTQYLYKTVSYKLPADKHIVILGDSHTECDINDQILSSSINLSQSGTGYLYSYLTLRELTKQNRHIDTVILSYFYMSLSQEYDKILYSDERYSFKLPTYLSLMTYDDITFTKQSLSSIASAYVESVQYLPSIILNGLYFKNFNLGGYLKLDRNKLQQDIDRYDTITPITKFVDLQTTQAQMLAKIKILCDDNNITLILIDTPVYQVGKFIDKAAFDTQRAAHLKEYQYIDYSNFSLPEDCHGDVTHLNYKGAEIFSKYLQQNGIIPKSTQN